MQKVVVGRSSKHLKPRATQQPVYAERRNPAADPDDSPEGDVAAYVDRGDFAGAMKVCEQAIRKSPKSSKLLEQYAEVLMEAGKPDEATAALRQAIAVDGTSGFEKFMYIGQLLGNTLEAVSMLRRGIEVLRNHISSARSECAESVDELTGYEVSALCSIAEVMLCLAEKSSDTESTRHCDDEIELTIGQALAICVEGTAGEVEATMALANLRLSQGRIEEAKSAMLRVVASMRHGLEILDECEEGGKDLVNAIESLPSMDVRIAAGKQLLEVSQWREAATVLSSVLYECDFNVEVWYMLSLAYHKLGDSDSALAALEHVRTTMTSPDGYTGQLDETLILQLADDIEQCSSQHPQNGGSITD